LVNRRTVVTIVGASLRGSPDFGCQGRPEGRPYSLASSPNLLSALCFRAAD